MTSLVSYFESGSELCIEHGNLTLQVRSNKEKRIRNINASYILSKSTKESEKFIQISSNYKGSSGYAYRFRIRLGSSPSFNYKGFSYLLTLTYPSRSYCVGCSYRGISKLWRSLRQNWCNNRLPKMVSFIGVIEPHRDGYPHIHIIMFVGRKFKPAEYSSLFMLWGARVDIEPIYNSSRQPLSYALKYVTKTNNDLTFMSLLSVLKVRHFFYSRGFLPKYVSPGEKAKYFFFGKTSEDIRSYNEFQEWSPLSGMPNPQGNINDGWDYISNVKDLFLYGRYVKKPPS